MPNNVIPVKNDVHNYFLKAWGNTIKGMKWKGWRERTIQDDLNDGNAIVIDTDNEDSADFVPDI